MVNVRVPKLSHTSKEGDVSTESFEELTTTQGAEKTTNAAFAMLKSVNGLLWFALGILLFFTVVGAGIYLITSQGNEDKLKQANRMLTYAVIALVIAALAGTIILTIVNFFGDAPT